MTSLIEAIKAKIDVVEEVGLVVALRKSGKSLQGLCPFHNERTPSFYVFPESQTWRCFGCNEGGDVFTFVEKQQGLDFRDALHYLAEKVGVGFSIKTSRSGASSLSRAWRTHSTHSGVPPVSGSGAGCSNLPLARSLRRSAASRFNAILYRYVRTEARGS